jgi:glycosyltransferase involved in cell wall biosynthesis
VAIYSPGSSIYFGGFEAEAGGRTGAVGGGAERQMANLAQELAERDLRVALITWPVDRPEGLSSNLDFVERPRHVGTEARFGKLREGARVWRACAAADASVYVYRGGGPLLSVVAAFCRLRRRKLIFSVASDLDFDFDRPDRSRSQLVLYRRALPRVDLIVAQRDEQLELARKAGFGPVIMIRSSSLPADVSRQEPEAFLWIGRLVDYKRPLSFVRLAESLPEARFWAVWIVTDETRPALAENVEEAVERVPNLEVLGQLPHDELLALIDRALAVVSTSSAEGMPNVFLEAWARGVPVLSLDYDPDGKIESLGLGIVAVSSEERFSESARRLLEEPQLRSQMGERGREYVLNEHSPSVVAERWAEVVRGLIADEPVAGGRAAA